MENDGVLGSKMIVNLDNKTCAELEKSSLLFSIEQGVDMIFASFIQTAAAVHEIRKILGKLKKLF